MTIQTVLGPIDKTQLGFTLMHEHLYLGSWNNRVADPDWFNHDEALKMICEVLEDAKKHGVSTIVDVTTRNMGRDMNLLIEASKKSKINIISATGCMYDDSTWGQRIPEENIVRLIVHEARKGIQGLNSRCGIIKTGTSEIGINESNKKILSACSKAAVITGLPIITHCRPANTRQGLFQQDIFEKNGVDLNKVIIGHFRIGDPISYAEEVMQRGSYIGIDQMNFNNHHLTHNLDVIVELIKRGWSKHIILSHDAVIVFNHSSWLDFDHKKYINYSPTSYSHISRQVIPKLLNRGIPNDIIKTIFVENPARIFCSE